MHVNNMKNVFSVFEERGFVEQTTDPQLMRDLLEKPVTCYIGFDPTAKSFHVGSLLPIMALVHMQKAGHRPIALIGGGTGLVGDPSGKTETRPIMIREQIDQNGEALKKQLSRFISFADDRAIMVNNADWLTGLNYIAFLRDIGRHFSVNRMLAAESYKARLETGLNFIEFNYMLLQAYDFWYLFKEFDCRLQMGGNDQWGNILAGADLIRRIEGEVVHALTFPLLTTSAGTKMGKTLKGAIWLDPELTSPYEYYQYWINQGDQDIERFLALFTFLPMEQIRRLGKLKGADLREAKETLAYETTKICHGEKAADEARQAARGLFGKKASESTAAVPAWLLNRDALEKGVPAYILFQEAGLCKTRGEARRLISQGGGYLNERRIETFDQVIDVRDLDTNELILRAGKKRYLKITVM
jgi:tyrosyl-tRNA synthetase